MMGRVFQLLAAVMLLPLSSPAAPLPQKAALLASNTVVAEFLGTSKIPCMGRTALCPDRCGHAASVAVFRVISNEAYTKHGQYGDAKAEPGGELIVEVKADIPGQEPSVSDTLSSLIPGDRVRLTQKHYYADLGGVYMPIRPVTELIVTKKTDTPLPPMPENPHPVMPIMR